MKSLQNRITVNKSILSICFTLLCTQADATLISFGGQFATDGSGLTSNFVDASNKLNPANGYLIETFDEDTKMIGFESYAQDKGYNWTGLNLANSISSKCGVNSIAQGNGVAVTTTGGGLGVKGDGTPNAHGVGAPPGGSNPTIGDKTCFGFTPGTGSSGTVTVDYANFLLPGVAIDYLGFYWGSIDSYNDFYFYDANGVEIEKILGTELLALTHGSTGNQSSPESNLYVNIDFDAIEAFTSFKVVSNGIAGEFDNIVVGLTNRPIPEPASLALLGLGLVGLSFGRRQRKYQN
jgi:hypothetical protein